MSGHPDAASRRTSNRSGLGDSTSRTHKRRCDGYTGSSVLGLYKKARIIHVVQIVPVERCVRLRDYERRSISPEQRLDAVASLAQESPAAKDPAKLLWSRISCNPAG
jgi:hypothetical protein